ncbi:MAG: hypothetical protein ACI4Q3_10300 [Kiritimatiellia bacterium]
MKTLPTFMWSVLLGSALVAGAAGTSVPDAAATNAVPVAEEKAYVPPAEAQLSDTEIWNRGYDFWKAGDMTNALAVLEPLMLSRTHGARAAEIVGAIHYADAKSARAEDPEKACKAAESAAVAMQIALRKAAGDARLNRNFTRAVDPLEELRETAHVAKVLKAMQKEQPPQLLAKAKKEALDLFNAQKGVLTNEAARAVAESERLAKRAENLADFLIPLKQSILQSVTNGQQAAQIVGDIEATRDATRKAADELADMSPEAALDLSRVESAFHRYWKPTLEPLEAVAESARAQTNVVAGVEKENGRDWQQEALEFTHVFRSRFPQWVQQACAQDQPADTNQPPFTAELSKDVAELAEQIAGRQEELVKGALPGEQKKLLPQIDRLRERCAMLGIQERLPSAIDRDIFCQTNAYLKTRRTDGYDWQADALDYTRVFRCKFPAWAQQKEQEIQKKIQEGATNTPPFTKEAQAEIVKLAGESEILQRACVEKADRQKQFAALEKLVRIRELLPPEDGKSGGQPNQQPDKNPNRPDPDQKNDQDDSDRQDQQQDQQDQQQEQKAQEQDDPKNDKDVEELLRKAKERSDEHEADKRARARQVPPSPNERDW